MESTSLVASLKERFDLEKFEGALDRLNAKDIGSSSQVSSILIGTGTVLNRPGLPVTVLHDVTSVNHSSCWFQVPADSWISEFPAFTDIPYVVDAYQYAGPVFDQLPLTEAFIVIATSDFDAVIEGLPKVPLKKGLNFAGRLGLTGPYAILQKVLDLGEGPSVSGQIVLPTENALANKVAGIYLETTLLESWTWGKLEFGPIVGSAYSPLSYEQYLKDPKQDPQFGISWEIRAPSGGYPAAERMSVKLSTKFSPDFREIELECAGEAITIRNLAQFAGLLGDGVKDPSEFFPADLRTKLSQLQPKKLSIGLDCRGKEEGEVTFPRLSHITFVAGFGDLNWKLCEGFTVNEIDITFVVRSRGDWPKDSGSVNWEVHLSGKVTAFQKKVGLEGSYAPGQGFAFSVKLKDGSAIDLDEFLSSQNSRPLALSVPKIKELSLIARPQAEAYYFDVSLADWKGRVGDCVFDLKNLEVQLARVSGSTVGFVSGELALLGSTSIARWDIGGGFHSETKIPEIVLSELTKKLDKTWTIALPFDVTLENTSIIVSRSGQGEFDLSLSTFVEGYGGLGLRAGRVSGQTQLAFGVAIEQSKITGTKDFAKALKALMSEAGLEKAYLIASNAKVDQFKLELGDGGTLERTIEKGVVIYSRWKISPDSKSSLVQILHSIFGLTAELDAFVEYGEKVQRLYVEAAFHIGDSINVVGKAGIERRSDGFSLFVQGKTTGLKLGGVPVEFELQAAAGTGEGFSIFGSMVAASGWTGVPLIGELKLNSLAAALSVSKSGVGGGFSAMISHGNFSAFGTIVYRNGKFGLVAAMDDLSLGDIIRCLGVSVEKGAFYDEIKIVGIDVGSDKVDPHSFGVSSSASKEVFAYASKIVTNAPQTGLTFPNSEADVLVVKKTDRSWTLLNQADGKLYSAELVGNQLKISLKAQFKFATVDFEKPKIQKGIFIAATLKVFTWQASLLFEMSESGVRATGKIDPLRLDLPVIGTVFSLTGSEGTGGPRLSISTFASAKNISERQHQEYVQQLRSSEIQIRENAFESLAKSRHFMLDGKFNFLGMESKVFCLVTEVGVDFNVRYSLSISGISASAALDVSLSRSNGLFTRGEFVLSIGTIDLGWFGTYSIEAGIAANVSILVGGRATAFEATFGLSVFYKKERLVLADFRLSISNANLGVVLSSLREAVIDGVVNNLLGSPANVLEKGRFIMVDIANDSDYSLELMKEQYFDSGRFWNELPKSISAFASGSFAACNKDNAWAGVSGAIAYLMKSRNRSTDVPVVVAFSHPAISEWSWNDGIKSNRRCSAVALVPTLCEAPVATVERTMHPIWIGLGTANENVKTEEDARMKITTYSGARSRIVIRTPGCMPAKKMVVLWTAFDSAVFAMTESGNLYSKAYNCGTHQFRKAPIWSEDWTLLNMSFAYNGHHFWCGFVDMAVAWIDNLAKERRLDDSKKGELLAINSQGELLWAWIDQKGKPKVVFPYTVGLPKKLANVAMASNSEARCIQAVSSPENGGSVYYRVVHLEKSTSSSWGKLRDGAVGQLEAVWREGLGATLFVLLPNGDLRFTPDIHTGNEPYGFDYVIPKIGPKVLSYQVTFGPGLWYLFGLDENGTIRQGAGNDPKNFSWQELEFESRSDGSGGTIWVTSLATVISAENHLELFALDETGVLLHNWSKDPSGRSWTHDKWVRKFLDAPLGRRVFCSRGADSGLELFLVGKEDGKLHHARLYRGGAQKQWVWSSFTEVG